MKEHTSKESLMFELVSFIFLTSVFLVILLFGLVDVRHVLLRQEILYSKLLEIVSFFIWLLLIPE